MSGARSRTRRAILSAAASVLARDRTATLPAIAEAANVGRTTLHRYFPDREALIRETIKDSAEVVSRSVQDAAPHEGPPLEAFRRVITAFVDVGDRLMFLFGDPRLLESRGPTSQPIAPGDPVLDLIRRGQAEGVFDPELSPFWIRSVVWSLVYTGCEEAANGNLPRHGVVSTVLRTLENGITRTPARSS
ncbi:transcriptional regulator, TetR family [Streptoalloteichus tenebrarius]|uniref:Transcriptional regulator, TetR family n=1 Tax=Streptoalloteichus tenebrarius (strain ATCC 17920 / DSM 40477 / JCM 4838 / CBS 697.72 / NBRC 16177 / NCIMB 11028 / NRRL B-12390 / A12253. 1 / ISP 5477) TaxID=1933 RepID=A0ABT1HS10_STRSD|nr:TetR/AcrR family transcriptional regulator [Streptoalloteichus tenebrarius]MCP2258263.1 transcriptional regulator, TetR family [Streptoalloteichus tenebrarius]BFF04507.1 TetR/AcrR family transcriptional regulator [Streptoalloteichus tenebrarius]